MKRRLFALGLALSALAGACGGNEGTGNNIDTGDTSESIDNTLEVTMEDYSFAIEGEVSAGPALLNFTNNGGEFHHAIVGKLDEGKTLEDVQAFVEKGTDRPPPPWFDDGPIDQTLISPGQNAGVVVELDEGTHVLLCFMPDPEGQPHVEHGMVQTFEVAAAGDAAPVEADDSITMTKEGAGAPELPAGRSFLEVTNEDKEPGEVYIVQVPEGNSLDGLDGWFRGGQKGEAPVHFFGGTHAFDPGKTVTLSFDLEPGDYQIVASYGEGPNINDVPTDFTVEG